MTEADRQWGLSNPGPDKLLVWLEQWAEEFEVPVGSSISLKGVSSTEDGMPENAEWSDDHLVVWVDTPGTVEAFIDGALQESASASVPIPEGMTKHMLNVMFAGQPAARLGGRKFDGSGQISWWERVRLRLGL